MKSSTFYYLSILICMSTSFKVTANAVNQTELNTIKQQIKRIHWHTLNESDHWGYTIESVLDNGKLQHRVQRYNPNLPTAQQWQLLEQDNKTPSKAMLKEYTDIHSSIQNNEPQISISDLEIVPLVTLKLIEAQKKFAIYSFKPFLPMFDQEVNKIFDGKLYFDKDKHSVVKVSINAIAPFSPALSIKVKHYEMNIHINNIEQQLHVTQINSSKSGSAFVFTTFNEIKTLNFSQFILKEAQL